MLFERPIHVGDTVEVGSPQGVVRRIGIRASVLHTGQGADIIVPNSQLVTEKVTNWTLSDKLRRIDLPLGVNYGANPKKVVDLLMSVADAHPQVLKRPPPEAFFELRRQLDQFRVAGVDGPIQPSNTNQKRFGFGRVRCGDRGGIVLPLSPA